MTAMVARNAPLLAGLGFAVLLAAPAQAGDCYGGECYRQVYTPPVIGTSYEQRLMRAPRTVYRTTPPAYETVSERVMVSPGTARWTTRYDAYGRPIRCVVRTPPQYTTMPRRVMVRAPEVVPETIPPAYGGYATPVLLRPGGNTWVPANSDYGNVRGGRYMSGSPSIPDRVGMTGASSSDLGVALGFSSGSIYDGY